MTDQVDKSVLEMVENISNAAVRLDSIVKDLVDVDKLVAASKLGTKELMTEIGAQFTALRFKLNEANGKPTDLGKTLEELLRKAGVPVEQLVQAAEIMGTTKPMAVLWAMGITQHITGVRNVMNLANLQMLLGNMGVPGGGVNPLRGQNNVQGGGDMGALPDRLPGFQHVENAPLRARFEQAWGVALPAERGWHLSHMFEAMERGELTALYVIGENPVSSEADQNRARRLLGHLEHLVVQDVLMTATAELADVMERMLGEAQRASEVVRRLRDFFREGRTRLERVPVAELLEHLSPRAEHDAHDDGEGDVLHGVAEREGAPDRPCVDGARRDIAHRLGVRLHARTVEGRHEESARAQVPISVEQEERPRPEERLDDRRGLAGVQHVGGSGEDLPDGVRVADQHLGWKGRDPQCERVTETPATGLEERDGTAPEVEGLHEGGKRWAGRERWRWNANMVPWKSTRAIRNPCWKPGAARWKPWG